MIHYLVQRVAILCLLAGGLFPASALAHGNVTLEEDTCVRRIGGNMVHFSAYQPQHEPKAQYCTEIPEDGDTFLVVDLIDQSLRNLPLGVRIVKGQGEGGKDEDDQTVAYWKPASHPDGVVRGEAKLEKGVYRVIITAEGLSPSSYLLRVQQVDYSKFGRKAVGPIMVLLVLALIGYELSKGGRLRRWFGSRRTAP
ncbi:MAG: hypothetical protein FJ247_03350 [Nitrospira sp.]|nr:hypothetical protein [Nitrospira sp.]